jgi:hypothetical protein
MHQIAQINKKLFFRRTLAAKDEEIDRLNESFSSTERRPFSASPNETGNEAKEHGGESSELEEMSNKQALEALQAEQVTFRAWGTDALYYKFSPLLTR